MNKSPERKDKPTKEKEKIPTKEQLKKENEIASPKATKEKYDKPKSKI